MGKILKICANFALGEDRGYIHKNPGCTKDVPYVKEIKGDFVTGKFQVCAQSLMYYS